MFAGSVLFVLSDTVIALGAFGDLDIGHWRGALIMATYVVGQYLIVTGLVRGLNAVQRPQDSVAPEVSAAAG